MLHRVGDDKTRAVGAEGPALRQEVCKPGILLGVVGSPGVHHAQPVALYLLGQQPHTVVNAVFVPVGGQQRRPGERIHRIGDHAEQTPEPVLPCLAGVQLHQRAVGLKLRHAHVLHAAAHRGNTLGGHEQKGVTVEQPLLRHDLHRGHGVVPPRPRHLIQLKFPPLDGGLVNVTDADHIHRVAGEQLQPHGDGAAHIADGQNVDALFPGSGLPRGHLTPPGMVKIHGPQALGQPLCRLRRRRLRQRNAAAVQPRHILLRRRQLGQRGDGKGGPSALGRTAEEKHGVLPAVLRRRQGQRLTGNIVVSVFTIPIHGDPSFSGIGFPAAAAFPDRPADSRKPRRPAGISFFPYRGTEAAPPPR